MRLGGSKALIVVDATKRDDAMQRPLAGADAAAVIAGMNDPRGQTDDDAHIVRHRALFTRSFVVGRRAAGFSSVNSVW